MWAVVNEVGKIIYWSIANSKAEAITAAVGKRTVHQGGDAAEAVLRETHWREWKQRGAAVERVSVIGSHHFVELSMIADWAARFILKKVSPQHVLPSGNKTPETADDLLALRRALIKLTEG